MKDHMFILSYLGNWNKLIFTIVQCLTAYMPVIELLRNLPIHRKGIVADHRNRSWKGEGVFSCAAKAI